MDAGDVNDVAARLTMAGLEVEGVHNPYAALTGVTVARIASLEPHPAGRGLVICALETGGAPASVVCGATNIAQGDIVPWLPPGAVTAAGRKVAEAAIHGVTSRGMLAAGEDLGLEEKSTGIFILPAGLALGQTVAEALGRDADVLDVNVTPNRGDCLSHVGIAREVAAILGTTLKPPVPKLNEDAEPAGGAITVEVRDTAGCPRYIARVLKGIAIGPAPDWMARRLAAAGVRAINNVVDATNYVMLELGHPMHAFDLRRLDGGRIVVRRAAAGEQIVTIDGVTRTLDAQDLLIADATGAAAVAGVMGGARTGIAENTVDLVLECAAFEPRGVRRTSARLGLASESSFRFERGVDPGGLERAIDRCAELIVAAGGGRILKGRVAGGAPAPARRTVALRPARLAKLAGAPIAAFDAARVLAALGIETDAGADGALRCAIPTFRHDLALEEDLVEEVVRIWGYDRVPPAIPSSADFHVADRARRDIPRAIRAVMSAAGFHEVINYSFCAPLSAAALGIDIAPVAIRNPLSEDQAVMRTALVPGLVMNAVYNVRRQQRSLRLFELGRVYLPEAGAPLPREELRLGGLILGRRHERTWAHPDAEADFHDLKGAVEAILAALRIGGAAYVRDRLPAWLHPGRAATLLVDGSPAGALGQLHPRMAAAHDLPEATFVFELDAAVLARAAAADAIYRPLSEFPAVERDMALVVDDTVDAGALLDAVRAQGIAEVEGAVIFDVYAGPQVGEGRKNIAIGLTYRAADRTLKDAEVDALHARIVNALNVRFAAALRG